MNSPKSEANYINNINKNYFFLLAAFLIAFPPILGLIYIKLFGVNVIYWDQWELIPLIEKMYTGSLNLADLFSQHNEHRIFFPRIVMLTLAYITHYNNIVEMYFSWVLTLGTMLLILRMYLLDSGNPIPALFKFIPVAWLLFSFSQWQNILWGWQIQIYLCVLGFVASIYMLEKTSKLDKNIFLAAFSGVVSSFSFFNGLIVWPLGLVYLFLAKKIREKFSIVWILTGAIVLGIYLYNWIKPPYHPSLFYIIENPITGITYFFVTVGSPISFKEVSALENGILLSIFMLVTFAVVVKKRIITENAKWISFILFSLFSSMSLTIGRSGFGVEQGLSSRYITITSLGLIGTYLICSQLYSKFVSNDNKKILFLYGLLLLFVLVGVIAGYMEGIVAGEKEMAYRELTKTNLIDYNLKSDDDLKLLYPHPDIVRDRSKILEKYHLNVFHDEPIRKS